MLAPGWVGVTRSSGGARWGVTMGQRNAIEPRSAGLQTGIAAAGRETPVATFAHSRDPLRGQRNAVQPRSAGLQTGIAAAGRETPVATFAHSRDPRRGQRNAVQARSAGLQTGIAAAGRETPIAMFPHSRDPLRGQRNAIEPRSAGLKGPTGRTSRRSWCSPRERFAISDWVPAMGDQSDGSFVPLRGTMPV